MCLVFSLYINFHLIIPRVKIIKIAVLFKSLQSSKTHKNNTCSPQHHQPIAVLRRRNTVIIRSSARTGLRPLIRIGGRCSRAVWCRLRRSIATRTATTAASSASTSAQVASHAKPRAATVQARRKRANLAAHVHQMFARSAARRRCVRRSGVRSVLGIGAVIIDVIAGRRCCRTTAAGAIVVLVGATLERLLMLSSRSSGRLSDLHRLIAGDGRTPPLLFGQCVGETGARSGSMPLSRRCAYRLRHWATRARRPIRPCPHQSYTLLHAQYTQQQTDVTHVWPTDRLE